MLRYLLTIWAWCMLFMQVRGEIVHPTSDDECFREITTFVGINDTTLGTAQLRGIVSHPLLNNPNNQPFTCTNTPVRFTIQIPYRATKIEWLMRGIDGISPARDTTVLSPNPTDSFFAGGKMYYTFPLTADYSFSETGVKTVGMRYYHPSLRNATGSETSSFEVEVVAGPVVDLKVDFEGCTGGLAQFSAEAHSWLMPIKKYVWQINGVDAASKLQYAVVIENEGNQSVSFMAIAENGCAGTATTIIEAAPIPKITLSPQANVCAGQKMEISYLSTISSGEITRWDWDLGNGNLMQRSNGTPFMHAFSQPNNHQISVQAISDKGCKSATAFQTVQVHKSPEVTLALAGKPCVDSTLHWQSNTFGTTDRITQYHWLDDVGNLTSGESALSVGFRYDTPQNTGILRHWVKTASGCQSDTFTTTSFTIQENPTKTFEINKDTLCVGEKLWLSSNAPASVGSNWYWLINQKILTRMPPFEYPVNEAGHVNIQLRYQNAAGCGAKEVVKSVFIAPKPEVDAGPDLKTIKNTSIKILAPGAADAVSYSWEPVHLLSNPYVLNPIAVVHTDTRFTLTATNSYGCKASDQMTIKAMENIYIPSAFSPNGDGLNDIWKITGLSRDAISTVYIYDRYGQIVYQSKGYEHQWDGTKNGKPLPTGNYVYWVEAGDGTEKRTGNLTLIR